MSKLPNLDFGSPTIFFDSHPEEQESYVYSYWSSLKSNLKTAFTGEVPKFHPPGKLRIIWYTHDGNKGMKDYDLHEYAMVRNNFDVLLNMPEIRRVVIMGYSGQNPYIMGKEGRNPWADKFEREFGNARRQKREQENAEAPEGSAERAKWEKEKIDRMNNSKEGRTGMMVNIEEVIAKNDKAEEEKRKTEEDKIWEENEGLLSGEMV